jgi:hypothetical protein
VGLYPRRQSPGEKAGWDKEILEIELQSLVTMGFEVEITGFEVPEVDLILDAAAEKEQDPGPEDDLPEVRHDQPAVTRAGISGYSVRKAILATGCWPATPGILP